ncbi:hypothetical protein JCM10207_006427 [Rhodosporidiobolus poonsookiae]
MSPVTHILAVRYKPSTTAEERRGTADAILALPTRCVRDGKPYVTVVGGGKENSNHRAAKGFDHIFVFTFDSPEARDYFNTQDPVHLEFIAAASQGGNGPDDLIALDFSAGEFSLL